MHINNLYEFLTKIKIKVKFNYLKKETKTSEILKHVKKQLISGLFLSLRHK